MTTVHTLATCRSLRARAVVLAALLGIALGLVAAGWLSVPVLDHYAAIHDNAFRMTQAAHRAQIEAERRRQSRLAEIGAEVERLEAEYVASRGRE